MRKKQFEEEYTTAEEIKKNYLSNVRSKAAKVNDQLEKSGLPPLPKHKDEFMDLCNKLEV